MILNVIFKNIYFKNLTSKTITPHAHFYIRFEHFRSLLLLYRAVNKNIRGSIGGQIFDFHAFLVIF